MTVPRYREKTWRGLPGRQPPDLPGLAHPGGPPGDPRGGRGVSRSRHAARRRATRGGAGRGSPEGAARRPLDLLDGRRRASPSRWPTRPSRSRRRSAGSSRATSKHPAMFGIGAGIEQNTHRVGECVDLRELQHAIAVLARFPSALRRAAVARRRQRGPRLSQGRQPFVPVTGARFSSPGRSSSLAAGEEELLDAAAQQEAAPDREGRHHVPEVVLSVARAGANGLAGAVGGQVLTIQDAIAQRHGGDRASASRPGPAPASPDGTPGRAGP